MMVVGSRTTVVVVFVVGFRLVDIVVEVIVPPPVTAS